MKKIEKDVFVVVNKHDGRLYAGKCGKQCSYSDDNFKIYAKEASSKRSIAVSHFKEDLVVRRCQIEFYVDVEQGDE